MSGSEPSYDELARRLTEATQERDESRAARDTVEALLRGLPDLIFVLDRHKVLVHYYAHNPEDLLNPPERFMGRPVSDVLPPEVVHAFDIAFADALRSKEPQNLEYELNVGSSQTRHFEARLIPTNDDTVTVIARDVSAQKALEHQLRQSQKMEALGSLASGIAHDFNNVLTAIIGYSELLLAHVTDEVDIADVRQIRDASERATHLTNQLLAFSRTERLVPRVVNLNEVLSGLRGMLERIIREDVTLDMVMAPSLGHTKADPKHVEHLLLNLVVNARDAMPRGGRLTITTTNVVLDADFARQHAGTIPGRYVALAVTDTGTGMKPDVRARAFDPFFTTKPTGKGTGLGLSTVFWISQQHSGAVTVDSTPGRGTTLTTYWPRVDAPVDTVESSRTSDRPLEGTETVLLVEDDAAVREPVRRMLEQYGYRVLPAGDPAQAIALEAKYRGPIHLLLADIVMPELNGPDLAQRLTKRRPAMALLFMSGVVPRAPHALGAVSQRVHFLQKPFAPETLGAKVRECLDREMHPHDHGARPQ